MIAEPHKIKSVRKLNFNTYQYRQVILRNAFYNTFNIKSTDVIFDLTSKGTSARSQEQESGLLIGDETYAGSRNFANLQDAVNETFGHKFICPTHNLKGANKLITTTMLQKDSYILSNSLLPKLLVEDLKGQFLLLENTNNEKYLGNINLELLEEKLSSLKVSYIYIDVFSEGFKPISYSQIEEIKKLVDKYNTKLILNISNIVSHAIFFQQNDTSFKSKNLPTIIKEIATLANVVVIDAALESRCNVGGLIATNDNSLYEKYMNEVVVFEGLHTYGGMAGRTMELFARGIKEIAFESQVKWINHQNNTFAKLLKDIPLYEGCDGVYIKADEFLPQIKTNQANALAALIYLKSGVRCFIEDKFTNETVLPVQIPRLSYTQKQLASIAQSIVELYKERDKLTTFTLTNNPNWFDEAKYDWNNPVLTPTIFDVSTYKITTIEYVGISEKEYREELVKEIGYNTFLLPSKDVNIDLLTDSGTCAQTTEQWSKYNEGDETGASSKDYFDLVSSLQEITGYKYIVPTHQGRAAEHIMSQVLIKDGFIPGNMYFTTTKLHQEMAGGTFVDVICDEAHKPTSNFQWKGNIDLNKVKAILDKHGEGCIPYISFEFSVNLAGGQPVSMDNAKEVYHFCKKRNIPVMFDATRAVENAYMIKKKDPRYANVSIKEILKELFSYGDGCTVSSKKDYLVNIGGFLGIRDDSDFYKKALDMLRIYEGTRTNGGMSAADMAVHAQGVKEMTDFKYIKNRVEQTQYLGNKLLKAGIPIVEPVGTHAVFLDAKRFLPHIDQDNYPAQALAAALFVESGIRAMERGNVSSGRNAKTGENYRPALELVRLTIPRRAYTQSHMDLIANSIIKLYEQRESIKGLEFIYEPKNLRFFQGRFKKI